MDVASDISLSSLFALCFISSTLKNSKQRVSISFYYLKKIFNLKWFWSCDSWWIFEGRNFLKASLLAKVYAAHFFLSSPWQPDAAPNTKLTICFTLDSSYSALIKCFPWSQTPQVLPVEDIVKATNRQTYFQNIVKDKHWSELALD